MEKKKKHILEKTAELYLKYGIRSVTMEDVSREVGISKKTLYQYFKDKEDLVNQTIDNLIYQNHYEKAKKESDNAIDALLAMKNEIGG